MTASVAAERVDVPWWLVLINGICALFIGILLLIAPAKTTFLLVQFLGIYWLISGLFSIVRIFIGGGDIHWGWLLFSGILGIIAGILVLQHPLWSTALVPTVVAIIIGIYGIMAGIISLVEAFRGGFKWGALILGVLAIIFGLLLLLNPVMSTVALVFVAAFLGIIGGVVS